mmetsp:Transcript_4361/g.13797  ORF Transcript_4361/g.13797 Transcript_4361/m.13797 type:complete len:125 (+) Transcript_4361:13415-13789(+)
MLAGSNSLQSHSANKPSHPASHTNPHIVHTFPLNLCLIDQFVIGRCSGCSPRKLLRDCTCVAKQRCPRLRLRPSFTLAFGAACDRRAKCAKMGQFFYSTGRGGKKRKGGDKKKDKRRKRKLKEN